MKIRVGVLVSKGKKTGEGHTKPYRAAVKVDGQQYAAIVKHLPLDTVLAECVCAMVMRGWGLPVPEPVLIREHGEWLFASLEVGYPNLKQRLGLHDGLPPDTQVLLTKYAAMIVCGWADAPRALAVDELIANADRNLGNFLWDGVDHAYIDHERTLGLAPHEHNIMVVLAELAGKLDAMESGAVASALALDRSIPSEIESPEDVDFSGYVHYIEKRLGELPAKVLERFPQPDDLFAVKP
ncbi:hypothetical protein SAMN02949497_1260 [Methylomagnum ishizawai]|uniref:Uncharacterized protein n=1 Tax=Methylomagnum ishizawai TaxID=1760988 RepID=A0A1Y6D0P0_9GAMM|nr:hypothetical protein [Methylomagnum ishizawai]SMF93964.1 hypothetical protein SAMN02949497_1260 [Methylomagnum ishizawai]